MIKREDLKKGDKVLIDPYCMSNHQPLECVVVSIGPKYIGVQEINDNDEPYAAVKKFHNNDEMKSAENWTNRLFLGTIEEYYAKIAKQKLAESVYREIMAKLQKNIGLEKMAAINLILDEPSLADAVEKIKEML